jgi:putative transcriptional regulator
MESLRGRLLISGGGLFDPNFRHTVVLIGQHDADGAVGVVLNRPMDVTVLQAVPPLAPLVEPGEVLYHGGPVQVDQPVLLAEVLRPELADVLAFGCVGFLTDDVAADIAPHIRRARVFAGHAGWGAGQLEAEMETGSWILGEPHEDDVFTHEPNTLWRHVLERKGPRYRVLSRMPADPSMN